MIERPFTAEMRSPTCNRPQRSVGLPSMMRPILCGITEIKGIVRQGANTDCRDAVKKYLLIERLFFLSHKVVMHRAYPQNTANRGELTSH